MKAKVNYKCTNCSYISIRWVGCCPSCNEWNSLVEQDVSHSFSDCAVKKIDSIRLMQLSEIESEEQARMQSGVAEWDRVMGGGILPGSFIILTGDPGIGKSTLLLQVASQISRKHKVIYFSSEESLQQVKSRADRLNVLQNSNLFMIRSHKLRKDFDNQVGVGLFFSDQACLENILQIAQQEKPDLLILDSIQNCHLSTQSQGIPGTIGQLREAGFHLMKLAKENNIAICITGHITKEGQIAGPKVLEHMVDGVFYLQGEDRLNTRILRSVKNRFGTIYESGFFQMSESGLNPVPDINQYVLDQICCMPGSTLVSSLQGSRPILVELQALCVSTKFAIPQRVITGLDHKRVMLIAAILEKYLHIKFSSQDIFFKVSGGFKIKESSCDLGIALALLSSYFQKPLPNKAISFAEISLTGQIKPINQIDIRIKEAERYGIENVLVSRSQKIQTTCKTLMFKNVYELFNLFPEEI